MMGLTPKQLECFRFIAGYIRDKGCSPTFDEVCEAMGSSSRSSAHRLIHALIERGWLRQKHGAKRSLEVIAKSDAVTLAPEIERGVDQYASEHKIDRKTAINELLRLQLGAVAA